MLALAVLAGGLVLFLGRGKIPGVSHHRTASAKVKGSYRNRSFTPPAPVVAKDAPEQPAVRGNVYDLDGNLVGDALLTALTYDVAGNMASPVGTFRSDDEGHFEIPLREGSYQLNVSKAGFGPTSVSVHTGDTISVVLTRSGALAGHVVDEKGKPVRHFTVDLVSAVPGDAPSPPPIWSKTFDSRDGAFQTDQLPAWPVIVRAVADDYAPGFSKPIELRPGESREVQITLSEGCTLQGKVVDKKDQPLPRVLVNAEERMTAGTMADPAVQAATQTVSADDGTFSLDHVPRGTVMVRGYDGDNAASTVTIDVKECDKLSPVKLVMTPGGGVEGVARTTDGKPIAGARVSINDRSVGIINTVTGPDGAYHFDDLPPGVMRVELDHEGQSALNFVQIRDGATSHLDLTLFEEGTGSIKGRVVSGDKPLSGMRLLVAKNHGRAKGIAMYFPVTGPDGTFTVPKLPAGPYLVSVMSTPSGRGVQVAKDEVATLDIDIGAMPGVPDPNAPPPRPHARRGRAAQAQQQQQGAEGQAADPPAPAEGATPSP